VASGAGVNRVGNLGAVPLLTIPPGASTPVAVAYGAYGSNSGAPFSQVQNGIFNAATIGTDSGVQMLSAVGFTKWTFCLVGPGVIAAGTAAFNIAIYGTTDPTLLGQSYATAATLIGTQGHDPNFQASLTIIPATSWFLLPAPSEQSGTGLVSNPLTTAAAGPSILSVSMPLVAVRAVLVGPAPTTGTGPITVLGFAVP
jgi:hypothetical protein